jgi:hypothetical protein
MIPGLNITSEQEVLVRSFFADWAEHFRTRLESEGVPGLLTTYEAVAEGIAAQSCVHGPRGSRQTGAAWQSCCGVSYEYKNDIAVRDALEYLLAISPVALSDEARSQVAAIDDVLYVLYIHAPERLGPWWHHGFPAGVIE